MRLVRRGELLKRVVWCTAVNTRNHAKMLRWREYRKALIAVGVTAVEGHFTEEPRRCDRGHAYFHPTEKEGDVNLAIHLVSDAHLDIYDVAYVLTADSDQLATFKLFRARFPTKEIISIAPPGRTHSKAILAYAHDNRRVERAALSESLLPGPVIIRNGQRIATRPAAYDPPA